MIVTHEIQTHQRLLMVIGGVFTGLGLLMQAAGMATGSTICFYLAGVIAGTPIAVNALTALRYRQISIELLVTVATVGAMAIGEPVESAIVSFLFLFGAWLEERSLAKTRSTIQDLEANAPKTARKVVGEARRVIPIDQLAVGDVVEVFAGEMVPADGEIIHGQGRVSEAAITGEAAQRHKTLGAHVYSGTQLTDGRVIVRVDQVGYQTVYQQIIALIEDAQDNESPVATFIQRFARWYTPAVLVISLLVFALSRDVRLAITILVLGCPGALVIGAPVSNVVALGMAANHGILIKGGNVATLIDQVDTIMFDKTGTLTQGAVTLQHAQYFEMPPETVQAMVVAVERQNQHPLGQALIKAFPHTPALAVSKLTVLRGQGVSATVAGQTVMIGNSRLLAGITLTPTQQIQVKAAEASGASLVVVAIDQALAAIYQLRDQAKPEAAATLTQLQAQQVQTVVLSGDAQAVVDHLATTLPLNEAHGGLLPADKVAAIKAAQAQGHTVMFVGDGINDGPALAQADVGVAMGSGMDVAIDAADVILTNNRVSQLLVLRDLVHRLNANIKENLIIALGTVALLLSGLAIGWVTMGSGMLFHEISILLVIGNALRLRHEKRTPRSVKVDADQGPQFEQLP